MTRNPTSPTSLSFGWACATKSIKCLHIIDSGHEPRAGSDLQTAVTQLRENTRLKVERTRARRLWFEYGIVAQVLGAKYRDYTEEEKKAHSAAQWIFFALRPYPIK